MDIQIKMAAVVAGLLAVKDKYIFTVHGHVISVSPIEDMETVKLIIFDNDNFYKCVLSKEEYEEMLEDFNGAA